MNSFNDIYSKTEEKFYYGTEPTKELEAFLNENHPPQGEALDIGSGEGRNTLLLARYGYHAHSVDYSSEGLHKLERYARSKNLNDIKYSIADARAIQLEPNFYDAIVAVTLLDHMSEEEGRKVASSLLKALKPSGFIYIEVFTKQDPGAKTTTQNESTEIISETASFVKHYFEEDELASWFSELKLLLYEEIMKYDDSHGEPHYHGVARLIGVKPMDAYHKLEKYEKALTDYTRAIELDPEEAWFYNDRANAYTALKRYEEALTDYTQAIKLDPEKVRSYDRRGDIYYKLKKYEEALTDYTRAIELEPERAWSYDRRGNTYYKLKKYEEALTDYTRAIELDPEKVWFYNDRANAYTALKRYEEALTDYTQAIKLDPEKAWSYNRRGDIYSKLEKYEEALADYTQAIELDPGEAWFYNDRANAYIALEKYKDDINHLL